MNELIASTLANQLFPLKQQGVLTDVAGLVQPVETDSFSVGKKKETLPAVLGVTSNACGDWKRLLPDPQKAAYVYFEDGGYNLGRLGHLQTVRSKLMLVGWFNTNLSTGYSSMALLRLVLQTLFPDGRTSRLVSGNTTSYGPVSLPDEQLRYVYTWIARKEERTTEPLPVLANAPSDAVMNFIYTWITNLEERTNLPLPQLPYVADGTLTPQITEATAAVAALSDIKLTSLSSVTADPFARYSAYSRLFNFKNPPYGWFAVDLNLTAFYNERCLV